MYLFKSGFALKILPGHFPLNNLQEKTDQLTPKRFHDNRKGYAVYKKKLIFLFFL